MSYYRRRVTTVSPCLSVNSSTSIQARSIKLGEEANLDTSVYVLGDQKAKVTRSKSIRYHFWPAATYCVGTGGWDAHWASGLSTVAEDDDFLFLEWR